MKKFEFSLSHMRDYKERLLDEEKGGWTANSPSFPWNW